MKFLGRKKEAVQPGRRSSVPGAKSAPVFSYYSSRSAGPERPRNLRNEHDGSRALQQRRTPWWLGYLPSFVALSTVALAALYVSTLTTSPRIEVIANENHPVVVQELGVYERAAKEELQSSIFSRSKLTINTNAVSNRLKERFPELGEIVVNVPLISRRPIIEVQPATPALIVSGQGGAFVIDDTGKPVLKASSLVSSAKDLLPVVTDDSGSSIELGKQLITTDLVAFIRQVDAQLKAKQQPIESYTLPALAAELHVLVRGQGYYVKFNTEADARQQVGTYLTVSERLQAEGKVPAEYIDVRVEERAYIK